MHEWYAPLAHCNTDKRCDMYRTVAVNPNYEVDESGNVRNALTKRIIKQRLDKYGYPKVTFNAGGLSTAAVHRLVAEAFIPNPGNLPCINHKDEDKTNNKASNLEWCTVAYNNRYGSHIEKCAASKERPVIGTKDGKELRFKSAREAGKELNIPWRYIGDAIYHRKNRKTAGGYEWRFE